MPLITHDLIISLALSGGIAVTATAILRLGLGEDRGRRLAGLGCGFGILFGWMVTVGFHLPPESLRQVIVHGLLGAVALGGVLEGSALRMRWMGWPLAGYALFCVWAGLGRPVFWPGFGLVFGAVLLLGGWGLLFGRLYTVGRREDAEAWGLVVSLAVGLAVVAWAAGNLTLVGPALVIAVGALGAACVAIPLRLPFGVAALTCSGAALMWVVQALAVPRPTLLAPLMVAALGLFAGATGRRLPWGARLGPLWSALLGVLPALLAAMIAASLPF
jgi:hypothetical protein